ncbi:MAG: phage tail sheath C-terminal domain-containing protein [Thermodesulfobacteriota bacterium]|nr:phage tail sheath C-terminal domain-containing protein [Thermodesulfobacteriota bacterium]
MATSYKTPGVYIEEISKFPPSVAQVATAIPAFIGYTEKAEKDNDEAALLNCPTRIRSLEEYRLIFGEAPWPSELKVKGRMEDDIFVPIGAAIDIGHKMFHSLELFFNNGGGHCYIVSVGNYSSSPTYADLKGGLDTLKKQDEPTLIVIPDAISLSAAEHGTLMGDALSQSNDLQDRFVIMDVFSGDESSVNASNTYTIATDFRSNVPGTYAKYGAAYFPFLKSFPTLRFNHENITFRDSLNAEISDLHNLDTSSATGTDFGAMIDELEAAKAIRDAVYAAVGIDSFKINFAAALTGVNYSARVSNAVNEIKTKAETLIDLLDPDAAVVISDTLSLHDKISELIDENSDLKSIVETMVAYDVMFPPSGLGVFTIETASNDPGDPKPAGFSIPSVDFVWEPAFNGTNYTDAPNYELYDLGDLTALTDIYSGATTDQQRYERAEPFLNSLYIRTLTILTAIAKEAQNSVDAKEEDLESTSVYQSVLRKIRSKPVELPPSGAIAGIYARVDKNRGVWKAPANVVVSSILGPSVRISDKDQESLNVDVTSGKSINAIRAFTGKGTLVWGARTLAGNDNEWRYVPVRRFFNMVEESVKKATAWAVFEPNDANLWVKVKGMIDNFLTTLWRSGALAGSSPDQAFFVKVGLNETMTSLDILEGRMIVEIGMAAVRPAEFIILKFSHKMQEA